jgi:hypothetical protein
LDWTKLSEKTNVAAFVLMSGTAIAGLYNWFTSPSIGVPTASVASVATPYPRLPILLTAVLILSLLFTGATHWMARRQRLAPSLGARPFRNVDEFYRTYSMRMLTETEVLVRAESDQYQPGSDCERYLVRVGAMLVTLLIFEKAWLMMYGSQLKALQQLNVRMLTYDEIREYYDEAVKGLPDFYKNVSFEMWVGFLESWILIRKYDLTHLEITIRGQDFLRYLVESRYDPATRVA